MKRFLKLSLLIKLDANKSLFSFLNSKVTVVVWTKDVEDWRKDFTTWNCLKKALEIKTWNTAQLLDDRVVTQSYPFYEFRIYIKNFKIISFCRKDSYQHIWNNLILPRSSHPKVLLGKVVMKICSKFTGEYLCRVWFQ